jgi:hypothetical protein
MPMSLPIVLLLTVHVNTGCTKTALDFVCEADIDLNLTLITARGGSPVDHGCVSNATRVKSSKF